MATNHLPAKRLDMFPKFCLGNVVMKRVDFWGKSLGTALEQPRPSHINAVQTSPGQSDSQPVEIFYLPMLTMPQGPVPATRSRAPLIVCMVGHNS